MGDGTPTRDDMAEEADARIRLLASAGYHRPAVGLWLGRRTPCVSERTVIGGRVFGAVYREDDGVGDLVPVFDAIRRFEDEGRGLVYAATVEDYGFGRRADLFYVSRYEHEWRWDRLDLKRGNPLIFLANLDDPGCDKYGCIRFEVRDGGLLRTE